MIRAHCVRLRHLSPARATPHCHHPWPLLFEQVHASLIVVLTRGGSTARLVAKYRPSIPVLTVAVPVLTTDSLTWTCSGEQPVRQCLITRGLLPLLAEGSARATDTDTTDEIIAVRAPCMRLNTLSCVAHTRARYGAAAWCVLVPGLSRNGACCCLAVEAEVAGRFNRARACR